MKAFKNLLREILNSFNYEKNVTCLEFGSGDGSSSVFNEYTKKYDISIPSFLQRRYTDCTNI